MSCLKKPCKECPFKRDSIPGWLGESSGDPEDFLEQLEHPTPIPCHLSVDWDLKGVELECEIRLAPACCGALQFMNNSCKLSKFKRIQDLQDEVGKNKNVFMWSKEFIEHHQL